MQKRHREDSEAVEMRAQGKMRITGRHGRGGRGSFDGRGRGARLGWAIEMRLCRILVRGHSPLARLLSSIRLGAPRCVSVDASGLLPCWRECRRGQNGIGRGWDTGRGTEDAQTPTVSHLYFRSNGCWRRRLRLESGSQAVGLSLPRECHSGALRGLQTKRTRPGQAPPA